MSNESFEARAWRWTSNIDGLAGLGTAGDVLVGLAEEVEAGIRCGILDPCRAGIVVAALQHLAAGGDLSERVSRIVAARLRSAQPQPEAAA